MLNERKNWYYCGILPDTHIDSKFKPVIVNAMDLKLNTSSLLRELQWKEDEYSRDKKQRAHYNRVRRIEELMAQVPDLPKELEDGAGCTGFWIRMDITHFIKKESCWERRAVLKRQSCTERMEEKRSDITISWYARPAGSG